MNELQVIEHSNQRVLLTSQIAEAYGATSKLLQITSITTKRDT